MRERAARPRWRGQRCSRDDGAAVARPSVAIARGGTRVDARPRPARRSPLAHSTFCTCSRICSISTLSSSAACDTSASTDFEPSVFASRCSSCARKSRRLPALPPAREHAPHFRDVRGRAARAPRRRRPWSRTARAPASAGPRWGRGPLRAAASRASRCRRRESRERAARRARPAPRCPRSRLRAPRRSWRLRARAPRRARAAPGRRAQRRARRARSGGTVGSARTPGQRRISLTESGAAPGTARVTSAAAAASWPMRAGVDGQPVAGLRRPVERDPALDLAALAAAPASVSRSAGSTVRSSSGSLSDEVEIAMVDRAQLDRERDARQFGGRPPQSRSC